MPNRYYPLDADTYVKAMRKFGGSQHQTFSSILPYYAAAQPAVGKFIDSDSDICRRVKEVSPRTTTIVRIYTGQPTIDDASQHSDPEAYGREYATLAYSRLKDPAHTDYLESENEPNDHYGNLTEFIKRLNAFLVGFSRRAAELGFRPLGPNFSTGYPEVYIPGSNYELWPNAWQGLASGLRAIRDANGALGLHEYDAPDLFRLWSDARQRGFLVGRHKAVYASLPADLQALPLYLTEFGVDFLVGNVEGGFWHDRDADTAAAWMCAQMRECWTRILSTTPQLKGVCFFLWGRNDPRWEEYDIARTDSSVETFTKFFGEELPVSLPPIVIPPYTGRVPFSAGYLVTQHFGERPDYYKQFGLAGHEGLDCISQDGDWNIHAVADGVVSRVDYNAASYGIFVVVLSLSERFALWYCHLAHANVVVAQTIRRGDVLGVMGDTGNTTGAHLHLGMRACDAAGNPINLDNGYKGFIDPEPLLTGAPAPQEPHVSTAQERIAHVWGSTGIDFNPGAAFFTFAQTHHLGYPVGNEYGYTDAAGAEQVGQGFSVAFVETKAGEFNQDQIKAYDWLTGEKYVAPQPPVVNPPPGGFVFPVVLSQIGAMGEAGTPVAGKPFYRLSPLASVTLGVSAFCEVVVFGKNAPAIGVQVVSIRPDGKGEIIMTGGDGKAKFNFGAASAFTPPAQGPFTIMLVDGAVKNDDTKIVTFATRLSDKVYSLGDYAGSHTEIYLQFVAQP